MRHLLSLGLLSLTMVTPGGPERAADVGLPNLIVEVAVDSLADVALAIYAPARGIILYNPTLQRQLGPALSRFFRAHEFGHLYHHHTRDGNSSAAELRRLELQADCYAAGRLDQSDHTAVVEAIAFFERQGNQALDLEHPTGDSRATTIRKCAR